MSHIEGQRLKMLYIKDYLERETDEKHPCTKQDLIDMLAGHGIEVTPKTLGRDVTALAEEYGMDIVTNGYRYFVASRDFDLEEVRMLVDMAQVSNFITKKKTGELIAKLQGLCSVHQAKSLNRDVYIRSRIKNMNESVYRNIDGISAAIAENKKIRFQYYSYNLQKEKEFRHGGRIHYVSPFALIYVDQNYYMLGYDAYATVKRLRHYRVDRMANISITRSFREGHELFEKTDMSTYTTKTFYMFTGDEQRVTLRFANELTDPVIDRFGEDVFLHPDGPKSFTVTTDVVVSPQFFAWLSAYGRKAEIVSPAAVREEFEAHLREILKVYQK